MEDSKLVRGLIVAGLLAIAPVIEGCSTLVRTGLIDRATAEHDRDLFYNRPERKQSIAPIIGKDLIVPLLIGAPNAYLIYHNKH
jgi:hypothetical protein